MHIDDQTDIRYFALGPVIEEYVSWYNDLLLFLHGANKKAPAAPQCFQKWLEEVGTVSLHDIFIAELGKQACELHEKASYISGREGFRNLKAGEFSAFVALFESFTNGLRRLERDLLYAGAGFDQKTGLRDVKSLHHDFSNDLELLRRYDQPFSIVLGKIDDYEHLCSESDEQARGRLLKEVGAVVRKSIRTFDEAYYLGNGEFVMACKHAPKAGGTVVVTRLAKVIDNKDLTLVSRQGKDLDPTMSFCVAEPSPGAELDGLLCEMKEDIARFSGEEGHVSLDHMELSPLQRYLDNQE